MYAVCTYDFDDSVGMVLRKLKDLGLEQNTLLVFSSDNGGTSVSSQEPLRDNKGSLYEGGIRVPLIVRWPGVTKPGTCAVPVINLDLYPTFVQAATTTAPNECKNLDGESLRPLLKGGTQLKRQSIFLNFPGYLDIPVIWGSGLDVRTGFRSRPASVIHKGDWKLHLLHEEWALDGGRDKLSSNHAVEFYNLGDDIGERKDLAQVNVAKRDELLDELLAWLKATNAKMAVKPNPKNDPQASLKKVKGQGKQPRRRRRMTLRKPFFIAPLALGQLHRYAVPAILFVLWTLHMQIYAAEYYADPLHGDGKNPGTVAAPWKSLDQVLAGNVLRAGDHLTLRRGYHGHIVVTGKNESDIVVEAEEGHTPMIRFLNFKGAVHWKFKGLTITPLAPPAGHSDLSMKGYGVDFDESSTLNTVENCYLYVTQSTAGWSKKQWEGGLKAGIHIDGPQNRVVGNYLYNAGKIGCMFSASKSYIGYNVIENFCSDGMGLKGSGSTVEYNLIMNAHKVSSNHNDLCQGYGRDMIFRFNELRAYTDVNEPFVDRRVQGLTGFDGKLSGWHIEGNLIRVDHLMAIWFDAPKKFTIIGNKVVRCTTPLVGVPVISVKKGKTGAPARDNIVKNNEAEKFHCGPESNNGVSIGIFENNKISSTYEPPADKEAPTVPAELQGVVIPGYGIDLRWKESSDNIKVLGYEIYRDAVKVGKVRGSTHYMLLCADAKGKYTIRAFDYITNLSQPSKALVVP